MKYDKLKPIKEKKHYLIYARKSSEAEDKQVQSIPDQLEVLKPLYAEKNLPILLTFSESRSAKMPGRTEFNKMIDLIKVRQDIKGIICWKLNRLSRNPVDEGIIRWLLQSGEIEQIITPDKTYTGIDSDFVMAIDGAQSQRFITDLTKDSKRGVDAKIAKGIAPLLAPLGYLNDTTKDQGNRDIIPDPQRFDLVRKMWDLLLTGQYNPKQILEIATDKWGLRRFRKGVMKKLSKTQIYELFTNIFYTGKYFIYAGVTYDNGIHKKMITVDEYDLAQKILGIKGKPRGISRDFSYTNWIKCSCDSSITADERFRKWCPNCKDKVNAEKYSNCPKCKTDLSEAKLQHIVQYHCTKAKNPICKQPSISLKDLEGQIDQILSTFEMPQAYIDWTLEELRRIDQAKSSERQTIEDSLHNSIMNIGKKLDNLKDKFLSSENRDGQLFTDQEYALEKARLIAEKDTLEESLKLKSKQQKEWLSKTEQAFNFTKQARYWFKNGTKEEKRAIFQCITGSNPVLEARIVRVGLLDAFEAIQRMARAISTIEPQGKIVDEAQTDTLRPMNKPLG